MYFAETYNAGQLQLSCMQFIALNLPALIDSNQLYAVENKCLSKIGEIYRRQVMWQVVIWFANMVM